MSSWEMTTRAGHALSYQVLGLADSLGEQFRVDRAPVDVLQRDPAPGRSRCSSMIQRTRFV